MFIATGGLGAPLAAGIYSSIASGATSATLGTALNGGSFGDCFKAGIKGAVIGGATAALGGGLSIIGGAGMSFAENLLLGTAEGAITGGFNSLLSGTNVWKGMLWGAASGAVLTTVFSENVSNLFKGEGFYTNENVFNHMIANGVSKQDILKYFKFEGKYYNGKYDNDAWFDPKNGIGYSDGAFISYHNLKQSNTKVMFEKIAYLNKSRVVPQNPTGVFDIDRWQQEFEGHKYLYKNKGFYPKATPDPIMPLNETIKQMQFYNTIYGNPIFNVPSFNKEWWHFIYKIPRRW